MLSIGSDKTRPALFTKPIDALILLKKSAKKYFLVYNGNSYRIQDVKKYPKTFFDRSSE